MKQQFATLGFDELTSKSKKLMEYTDVEAIAVAYSRRYHFPNEWKGDGSDYSIELHTAGNFILINQRFLLMIW